MTSETAVVILSFVAAVPTVLAMMALLSSRPAKWLEERMPHWLWCPVVGLVSLGLIVPISVLVCYLSGYGQ